LRAGGARPREAERGHISGLTSWGICREPFLRLSLFGCKRDSRKKRAVQSKAFGFRAERLSNKRRS
jgi:hypothetical protein